MTSNIEAPKHQPLRQRAAVALNHFIYGERHPMDAIKMAEWHSRCREIEDDYLRSLKRADQDRLLFEDRAEKDRLLRPYLTTALLTSDATQPEIDFLLDKIAHDPNPTHEINYAAGNNPDRGVIVEFPVKAPPLVSAHWETKQQAAYRVEQNADPNGYDEPDQLSSGRFVRVVKTRTPHGTALVVYRRKKPLVRHGALEVRGKRILPLPPRIEVNTTVFEMRGH
ncbi:MAG TPA: hypothetical protein VMR77_02190 [Patescibacteria group bacterium]|nr:hypothetical protein [Patescibacteria group bacterium]